MNSKRNKFILIILLNVFIFVFVFAFITIDLGPLKSENVKIAKAQAAAEAAAATTAQTMKDIIRAVKDAWKWLRDKVLIRTAKIAYKNALRNFLSQMAYRTAEWLAASGEGQGPLFTTESWKDFANNIVDTTLVDTLDVLASDNGFFEFNICQPADLDFSLNLLFTEFTEFSVQTSKVHKPRCEWQQLKKKWSDFGTSMAENFQDSGSFLASLEDAFRPTQQDVGIKIQIDTSITEKIKDKKTQQFLKRVEEQGLSGITEPITKSIKTPAKFVAGQAQTLPANAAVAETTPTMDIVADAMGIFTNTLMNKLIQRWLADATGGKERAETTEKYSFGPTTVGGTGQLALQQQFGGLAEVNFTSGQENVLEFLSSCPDPNNPGSIDCVIPPDLSTAIGNRLTVQEALEQGSLKGDWTIGWDQDQQPAFNSGYPYRSLVIMRIHRIIPVGWELAAWYAKKTGERVTLNDLINCFEDSDPQYAGDPRYPSSCREDINDTPGNDADDYNPYYHLVDPNWVLKAPETYCAKKGAGYKVISEELTCNDDNVAGTIKPSAPSDIIESPYCEMTAMNPDIPVRLISREDDYCADWQSCLLEDDQGNCTGVRGYCLEEKELWRFNGDSCPIQYNSCETLTRQSDGQPFNFLTNTLTQCLDPNDVGCKWYALEEERVVTTTSWNVGISDSKVYLNSEAAACEISDVGCTKLGRMVPGANLVLNGNFIKEDPTVYNIPSNPADLPLNWEVELIMADCEYDHEESTDEMRIKATDWNGSGSTHCTLRTSGFIPINPNFTYQLNYKAKAEVGVQAAFTLQLYDENKVLCNDSHPLPCRASLGIEPFGNVMVIGQEYKTYSYQIGPDSITGDDFVLGVKYIKFAIMGPHATGGAAGLNKNLWVDDVQFTIVKSPIVFQNPSNYIYDATSTYTVNYSENTSAQFSQHLKMAPAYLGCDKYNNILYQYTTEATCYNADPTFYWRSDIDFCVEGGSEQCQNYATYCQEEEIGCQGYLPANGDPEVPAVTAPEDVCPQECENYDTYIELNNFFEEVECPMHGSQTECNSMAGCQWLAGNCEAQISQKLFIPETAQACTIAEVGCEEFTNLDEVAKGGEGKEYFTQLRQCISPDNPNFGTWYTWEGSDTTGYQLKKWEFLKSNIEDYNFIITGVIPPFLNEDGVAPCTNIEIGTENCVDDDVSFNYNPASPNPYSITSPQVPKVCTQADIDEGEYDCRDFFDANGNHFFRRQSYAITASSNCHPYRRTATGQIYNTDPAEGTSCSAASNGCREYKGNAGNNVRVVFTDEFEDGTYGNWGNYIGDPAANVVSISNEAVVQGGHSLYVYNNGDSTGKTVTNQVTEGKEYKISFWAKKQWNTACSPKQVGSLPINPEPLFFFNYETSLTNFWAYYELGPITLQPDFDDSIFIVNIDVTDLDNCEGFYVDNIVFKEFTDNFYVVKSSWQTPVSCDNNLDNYLGIATCTGSPGTCQTTYNGVQFSCNIPAGFTFCQVAGLRLNMGAQEGCLEYRDRNEATHYLKKFTTICSDSAIGCEAYITTQNSTEYQSAHAYGNFICNDIVGDLTTSPGDCLIRGQVMCDVGTGDSCEYSSPPVANDEIVYVVNDPEKSCAAAKQGCSRVGLPELDLQIGNLADPNYVTSTETVLITNNPDDYDNTLCSPSGEFCTQYTIGSQGQFYYYDPTSFIGTETTNKTCYYDTTQNEWFESGNTATCTGQLFDPVKAVNYLPRSSDENYQGWVGLCSEENATCRVYRDPEKAEGADTEKCDAKLERQDIGVCEANLTTIGSHEYCRATVNGLEQNVCDVSNPENSDCEDLGSNYWQYPAYGWICNIGGVAVNNTDCCIGGQTFSCEDNELNEFKVCTVYAGNEFCYYNLFCEPYSYKQNTVSNEGCDGLVDREKGCILFKDSTLATSTITWASRLTNDGQVPQVCDPSRGVLFDDSCNANTLLKVRKDRECSEWLHCGSNFTDPGGQQLCTDLIRCRAVDGTGQNCTSIIPEPVAVDPLTIDLTNNTTRAANVNSIRYLSGYSKVGAIWKSSSPAIEVAGNYSPEQMEQFGNKVEVVNGDMETLTTEMNYQDPLSPPGPTNPGQLQIVLDELPISWEKSGRYRSDLNPPIYADDDYCEYKIEYQDPHSGQYSLGVNLKESAFELFWQVYYSSPSNPTTHNVYCGIKNKQGGSYYLINPSQHYTLNLWLKSQNGGQRAAYGITWYTIDGVICNSVNDYCHPSATPVKGLDSYGSSLTGYFSVPEQWTRYSLTFGPDELNCTNANPTACTVDKEIPPMARKAEIAIYGPNTSNGEGQPGYIYIDDVSIEPVLKINEDVLVAKDCRLFPKDDAPACAYANIQQFQGWNGYCLEPDPKSTYNPDPLNPIDRQTCLQWYPIDSLAGDSLVFNVENIGYVGPQDLYYCAQSTGYSNYGYSDTGPGCFTRGNYVQSHMSFESDQATCDSNQSNYDNCNDDDIPALNEQRTVSCWGTDQCGSHEHWMGSVTANFRLCLDEDDEGGWDWYYNELPDLDQNISLDDIEHIYTEALAASGGWNDPNIDQRMVGPTPDGDYIRFTENNWNDEGYVLHIYFCNLLAGCVNGPNTTFYHHIHKMYLDGDDNQTDGGIVFNLLYALREPCTTIVKAVSSDEKVWLSKYNEGWPTTNALGQYDNILGYNKYLPSGPPYPYYGVFGSVNNNSSNPPSSWTNVPYTVGLNSTSNAGLSYSTFFSNGQMSSTTETTGRACITGYERFGEPEDFAGKICYSNEDCGIDPEPGNAQGVCASIGKFCFNDQGISTGVLCDADNDCLAGEGQRCKAVGYTAENPSATANLFQPNLIDAIDRVQKLFAVIYNVWEWNEDTGDYEETTGDYDNLDKSDDYGSAPTITILNVGGYASGDVQVAVPGEEVTVQFNTDVPNNQLPIEEMVIDWQDGNVTNIAGPLADKPSGGSPHIISHTYSCQPDMNNSRCISCLPGGIYNSISGECKYYGPSINLRDHWDWCEDGSLLDFGTICTPQTGVSYGYYVIVGP